VQVEFVNPFVLGTCSVFSTMLGCELARGQLSLKQGLVPEFEVSGLIGLSGRCQGMIVVSLGRETAIKAAEIMLGDRPAELNADVCDAVGEIANMIAGAAKAQLEEYQLSISLPTVICGRNHSVNFPSSSTPFVLPFESAIGPVCIEVGMEPKAGA